MPGMTSVSWLRTRSRTTSDVARSVNGCRTQAKNPPIETASNPPGRVARASPSQARRCAISATRVLRHAPARVSPASAASCPTRGEQIATQSISLRTSRFSSGAATTAPTR